MTPRMNFRLVTFFGVSSILTCSEVSSTADSPGVFSGTELRNGICNRDATLVRSLVLCYLKLILQLIRLARCATRPHLTIRTPPQEALRFAEFEALVSLHN
jgi:hypothetical protein